MREIRMRDDSPPPPFGRPMKLSRETKVGVLGAGAMGAGIAQVAARHGHAVVVVDASAEALERGRGEAEKALGRDVEKGRVRENEAREVLARLRFAGRQGAGGM